MLVHSFLSWVSHLYDCKPSAPFDSLETCKSPTKPSNESSARDARASFISSADTSCAMASVADTTVEDVFSKDRMI